MGSGTTRHRPDIDGLRTIAILPVLLFHAGLSWTPGGFVGVDIFFVISGYLITGIIRRQLEAGRFSYPDFLERRARRIFPALFVMLAASTLVAVIILSPANLHRFGSGLIGTASFTSNFVFWNQQSYFETGWINILLHTWSLAIEEQFYIFFPAFMVISFAITPSRNRLVLALGTVVLASLAIAIIFVDRSASFFLLPARLWELGIGALLSIGAIPAPRRRLMGEAMGIVGVLLIAVAILCIDRAQPFPGWRALLPCVGTAMILHRNPVHATIVSRVLATRPMVSIGLISYSLYLWHWPILTFITIFKEGLEGWHAKAAGLMLAVLLAWISWRWIEAPFRDRQRFSRRTIYLASLAAILSTASIGALFARDGLPWRHPELGVVPEHSGHAAWPGNAICLIEPDYPADALDFAKCTLKAPSGEHRPLVFGWGDSWMDHYGAGMEQAGKRLDFTYMQAAYSACAPIVGLRSASRPICRSFNDRVIAQIGKLRPAIVILSAEWPIAADNLGSREALPGAVAQTIAKLKALGVSKVIIVGEAPNYIIDAGQIRIFTSETPPLAYPGRRFTTDIALSHLASEEVLFLSPKSYLCPSDTQCRLTDDQGRMLQFDQSHFTETGARFMAPFFEQAIAPMLTTPTATTSQ